MKKILLILFITITSLLCKGQTYHPVYNMEKSIYKFYKILIQGDSLYFTDPEIGQLVRYDGNKFTNWTPDYLTTFNEVDPFYINDSTDLKANIRELQGFDTTGIYHANRSLLNSIDVTDTTHWGRIETDPIYSAMKDSVIINIDFLDLTVFTYNVPVGMTLTNQVSESTDATLDPILGTSLNQFSKLIVTPSDTGLIILSGHKN